MARFDNIGRVLRTLRRERGWNQAEMARRAGVTAALLSNYELGRKVPSLRNLGRLLDALAVDLAQLDEQLDRLNERGPEHGPAGSRDRAVPGVDLARFFGLQTVPRRLEQPFAEMLQGFQSAARLVGQRMLDRGASVRGR